MYCARHFLLILLLRLVVSTGCSPSFAADTKPTERLAEVLPQTVEQCTSENVDQLTAASRELEQWAAQLAWQLPEKPDEVLKTVTQLLDVQREVAQSLDELLDLRTEFVRQEPVNRDQVRCFLRASGHMVDLSGRLRYTLRDALDNAAYSLVSDLVQFEQFIDLLIDRKDATGASISSFVLFDPPDNSDADVKPFPDELKSKVLKLILAAGSADLIGTLAELIQDERTSPQLVVSAAVVIKQLGLPQSARSVEVTEDEPPPITASELRVALEKIEPESLSQTQRLKRTDLIEWLIERERHGTRDPMLRIGRIEIQPGDWLLLRNPSPYNRFTDLSPGLFTHIAIATDEADENGFRRIVAVDLPERGASIPSTNVEAFLQRSLHYMILRHRDPQAARAMADAARSSIGNDSQFDLQFRTDRVNFAKGQSLRGQRLHAYCAGFMLACAQTTGLPRENFFPFEEVAATEKCRTNLLKLGLSFGDGFVSPTGPLFSPNFKLVAQREPMYDPGREIKEAVYDHFALGMAERELNSAPDLFQSLRLRAAKLSRTNAWLARALAQANGVSPDMDLESAAKAAAVVETLDEIADGSWQRFERARQAILAGTDDDLRRGEYSKDELRELMELRQQHAALLSRWLAEALTPRQLRLALVNFYSADGRRRIDEQFFNVP